ADSTIPDRGWRWEAAKASLKTMALSLIVMMAGFIPIAFILPPTLAVFESRSGMFAAIGASALITGYLYLIAHLIARNSRQISWLIGIALIPLLLIGLIVQASAQHEAQVRWMDQKALWTQMFRLAPDIREGTSIAIVFSGYVSP